jgi:hypothetical protein
MPYAQYNPDQVQSKGEALYQQRLRSQVEKDNKGRYLVLDIETGEFEIDDDDLTATKRILSRQPKAVLYGLRIGYPTAYRLGGRFTTEITK